MERSNVRVVAALYSAFVRQDLSTVRKLIGPGFTVMNSDQLPWGGRYEGMKGLREFTREVLGRVEPRMEVEEYVQAGDDVLAITRTRGYVRRTGNTFDIRSVHVWTVKDGRVVRFQPYVDTPEMLRILS